MIDEILKQMSTFARYAFVFNFIKQYAPANFKDKDIEKLTLKVLKEMGY